MAKKHVQVGQVFQPVGAAKGRAWRVTETVTLLGIPHARVVSTEDDGVSKTLSCSVLIDSDHYKLIASAPLDGVAA
ncbi:hypothetical protein [Azospirillum griseum]|uniref:Hypervirulence associated protein TUDOR domain-containing protein n=1 Tax=Azospirillum griseum TaxID=2496639 RepID=A0A3S0KVB9_9PROT|nr:hypothetical protein [Azospirillum griseum]RTR16021.1 hypothetical protein EJ903_21660 [Azospirillum griseum]